MKYIVSRVSAPDYVCPCNGAKLETFTKQAKYGVARPEDVQTKAQFGKSDWWYEDGRNHRIENGCIVKDYDVEKWVIEIKTLDELVLFAEENGNRILYSNEGHLDLPHPLLLIEDDYLC